MCVPPNIEKIKTWLSQGVPEKDIAKSLGVSYSTWRKWKKENDTLSALFNSVEVVSRVETLENTMFRLAQGYSKTVTKYMKVRDAGGGEHLEKYDEEIYFPPNFNALRFLIINWSNNYSNDPDLIKLRREEFEHRKELDERDAW